MASEATSTSANEEGSILEIYIRTLRAEDAPFLRDALYHAIYTPQGEAPAPREIIDEPSLAVYIEDFGKRAGDIGVIALDGEVRVGAAWARLMHAYGYVDDATPELSIALIPDYRGLGIGTLLMQSLLADLSQSAEQVSLSVHTANPAYRLYERLGFEVVAHGDAYVTMVRRFDS